MAEQNVSNDAKKDEQVDIAPTVTVTQAPANPLSGYYRQPKIYIRLPSGGKYWKRGSLEVTESGEYPVYSMTAKDELVLKTPDALMNGESTATMMSSCIPHIKNAFDCPSIDLDTILVAIRIATFGERLTITSKVPNTELTKDFDINLVELLDRLQQREYPEKFTIDDFTFTMEPTTYKLFTDMSLLRFEEQRKLQQIQGNDKMDDKEKLKLFNASFSKLTNIAVDLVISQIKSVQYLSDQPVTDKSHIKDFFENVEGTLYERIQKYIEELKEEFTIPDFDVTATPEEIEAGAPETYKVPVSFDQSNFFARQL
jgi:hypothetical protein